MRFWLLTNHIVNVCSDPPSIQVPMEDQCVKLGHPATLSTIITGQPLPEVYWLKVSNLYKKTVFRGGLGRASCRKHGEAKEQSKAIPNMSFQHENYWTDREVVCDFT